MSRTLKRPETARGGRFRIQILSPAGWTDGRQTYRRLKTARKAARWFGVLSEVRQVRVIDEVESRIAFEFTNPRRKPR